MRGARITAVVAFACSFASSRLTAQAVDPCTLLTVAEVNAVVGIKSLPGRPYLGSKIICLFAPDTSAISDFPVVNLMVQQVYMFQGQKNMGPHPVSGLGDEAYWTGGDYYAKLEVRKGNRAFSITVTGGKAGKKAQVLEQMEEALAKKVLARF